MWTKYGIMKENSTIIITNVVGGYVHAPIILTPCPYAPIRYVVGGYVHARADCALTVHWL